MLRLIVRMERPRPKDAASMVLYARTSPVSIRLIDQGIEVYHAPEIERSPVPERDKGADEYLHCYEKAYRMRCGDDAENSRVVVYFGPVACDIALHRRMPVVVAPRDICAARARGHGYGGYGNKQAVGVAIAKSACGIADLYSSFTSHASGQKLDIAHGYRRCRVLSTLRNQLLCLSACCKMFNGHALDGLVCLLSTVNCMQIDRENVGDRGASLGFTGDLIRATCMKEIDIS